MKLKNMKKHLLWVPAAALALTLAGQVATYYNQQPENSAAASWAFRPQSVQEARDKAHTIVRAQVVSVEKGEDLVVPAKGEPTGEDRLPTQRITVKVTKSFKGNAQVGNTLTLFQTGGDVTPNPAAPAGGQAQNKPEHREAPAGGKASANPNGTPPAGDHAVGATQGPKRFVLEGDPLYKAGEEFVLLLEDGPRGLLRPVSPEGRFKIENGTVKAMVTNAATRGVHGKPVADLERELGR
jgi:hypothetical protein